MRRISETILSTGVVPPGTVRLLERWGLIGAASVAVREDLTEALLEIERLVGLDRSSRRLAVLDDGGPEVEIRSDDGKLWSGRMCGDRLLIRRSPDWPHLPVVGSRLRTDKGPGGRAIHMETVYEDEAAVAALLTLGDRC